MIEGKVGVKIEESTAGMAKLVGEMTLENTG